MKKSFLALAVAALAATSISTASAATVYDKDGTSLAVYGRVQAVVYSDKTDNATFTANNGTKEQNATAVGSGRLGFDMRSQVYGDIAAFAKAEWDMSDGNGHQQFDARYMWIGLDFAQAGQFKLGTFEPAIKYAIEQTDIFDDWGCTGLAGNDDKREAMAMYSWSGYGVDVRASVELPGTKAQVDGAYKLQDEDADVDYGVALAVGYTSPDVVFGVDVRASVELPGTKAQVDGAYKLQDEDADVDYGVALAVGYTSPDVVFGPIAVRAGYEKVEFADSTTNNIASTHIYDSYDQYAIGVSWGSLNLGPYVGAVYHEREFDVNGINAGTDGYKTSVTGYEFVVGYSFANGISARTGYLVQEYKDDADKAEAKSVPVYVNWQLNPQVNVWAEARFDAGTDDSKEADGKNFQVLTGGQLLADGSIKGGVKYDENVFSAGIRYQF